MITTLEAPELGSDISECDGEPIHIPGSIQPHGLLLLAEGSDLRIVGGAGDLEEHFGTHWQDETLASLLGESTVETLLKCERAGCFLGRIAGTRWEAVGRRAGDLWLIELEESEQQTATDVLAWIDDAGLSFERAGGLLELCERAAESFRSLTGFDRVMIYRFLDDDSGVVIAEDLVEGLHSFRNHHFPASDIPSQARALYLRNRVRVIPDVAYQPRPIRPATHSRVDLSDVELRSVSPIHI